MHKLKVIQVNIYKGKYLPQLIDFLKKESPDIITTQEVTTGGFNLTGDLSANLFEVLKDKLKLKGVYHGDSKLTGSPGSLFGNAVFTKFRIKKSRVVTLKKFKSVTLDELDGRSANEIRPQIPRHILDVLVDLPSGEFHAISVHGAWTAPPTDTKENLRQAGLIRDYLDQLSKNSEPFIMGGDLNMPPGTKVIGMISSVSNNLMLKPGFTYSLNPKVHAIAPKNYLVDYIFISKHFKVLSVDVPEVSVSDHLPVVAKLEF